MRIVCFALLFLFPVLTKAEEVNQPGNQTDSTATINYQITKFAESRWFKATYLGIPLIAEGLIAKSQDSKFRKLRNDFMPEFHRHLDNYTQLAPAAVMLGLKALGVQSRSSWKRMMVSDLLSAGLMFAPVQLLKQATQIMRPDGSDKHSFPSGHTATAFMTATMLSKEYGYIHPLVSIGAYGTATLTGLMRMANNKHWISDVMVGAGIGIISTEFGYWIADRIYKDKGLNVKDAAFPTTHTSSKPSYFGLYMGFNIPLSQYDFNEHFEFETSYGTSLGIEGAWFMNSYIGIGGRFYMSNLQYILNKTMTSEDTFKFSTLTVGPYFSYPLTQQVRIGSKLLGGKVWYPTNKLPDIEIAKTSGLMVGTGVSVEYQMMSKFTTGLFLDYNIQAPASKQSKEYMHSMTLGSKFSLVF